MNKLTKIIASAILGGAILYNSPQALAQSPSTSISIAGNQFYESVFTKIKGYAQDSSSPHKSNSIQFITQLKSAVKNKFPQFDPRECRRCTDN